MLKTMSMNHPFDTVVSTNGAKGFWWLAAIVAILLILLSAAKATLHSRFIFLEFNHPVRSYFNNAPHIGLLMLSLGMPSNYSEHCVGFLRTIWVIAFALQCFLTNEIYSRWMQPTQQHDQRAEDLSLQNASPPFLLSTVGWLLLTVLGQSLKIEQAWGTSVPTYTLG